jgi:hypothetical protein
MKRRKYYQQSVLDLVHNGRTKENALFDYVIFVATLSLSLFTDITNLTFFFVEKINWLYF